VLTSFPIILLIGTALGFLSGLGIGGGSLLVLWLTFAENIDPPTARGINLLFFIPSALVAILFRHKQGKMDLSLILPAVISGTATAALCSYLFIDMDTTILKKLFGILLIAAGCRELMYQKK
jgi:uncharacterized membrane protein YfcA